MSEIRQRRTRQVAQFNNRPLVFVPDQDLMLRATAARDEEPGDWKTALARGTRGVTKGEAVTVLKVWQNLYGWWARIRIDGRADEIDVQPYSLILASPATCRVCGCTETRACPGRCWWVEPDLCSACQ